MQYGGVAALMMVGLWVYTVLDVLGTDDLLTRRLAKSVWLKLVMFLPLAGGIAWLITGRPDPSARAGAPGFRARQRMLGVEEFTQFVAGLQRASAGSRRASQSATQSWAKQREWGPAPLGGAATSWPTGSGTARRWTG